MRKKIQLVGYRSRGGRAVVHSPSKIEIFPKKHVDFSFDVPSSVSSVREAIDLLRKLAIASSYKSKKVTPIYSVSS